MCAATFSHNFSRKTEFLLITPNSLSRVSFSLVHIATNLHVASFHLSSYTSSNVLLVPAAISSSSGCVQHYLLVLRCFLERAFSPIPSAPRVASSTLQAHHCSSFLQSSHATSSHSPTHQIHHQLVPAALRSPRDACKHKGQDVRTTLCDTKRALPLLPRVSTSCVHHVIPAALHQLELDTSATNSRRINQAATCTGIQSAHTYLSQICIVYFCRCSLIELIFDHVRHSHHLMENHANNVGVRSFLNYREVHEANEGETCSNSCMEERLAQNDRICGKEYDADLEAHQMASLGQPSGVDIELGPYYYWVYREAFKAIRCFKNPENSTQKWLVQIFDKNPNRIRI
ncbi:hypothetical protein Scep_009921 [Stephania cephalantha]|uniref:Uncharacterized protein n=1 Tax=Stephania cephalantha TaxID=152367 RepID=A0AAP0JV39_9MAGN